MFRFSIFLMVSSSVVLLAQYLQEHQAVKAHIGHQGGRQRSNSLRAMGRKGSQRSGISGNAFLRWAHQWTMASVACGYSSDHIRTVFSNEWILRVRATDTSFVQLTSEADWVNWCSNVRCGLCRWLHRISCDSQELVLLSRRALRYR